MKPSPVCFALIKKFEGLCLIAYRDARGVPTIGYGHTRNVRMGDTCSTEQAEEWLIEDVDDHAKPILKLLLVKVTQGQFDALVSFAFNLGVRALKNSTLLRYLNAGDTELAAEEFAKWVHAGTQRLEGLVRRRDAERELFLS